MKPRSTHSTSSGSEPARFLKMAGGGNDFAVFDDREQRIGDPAALALALTTRGLSVGADGIILIRPSTRASFRMVYHNADGSLADFCANGTRCAARFALLEGIAPAEMTIETGHAVVPAAVTAEGMVTLSVPPPTEYEPEKPLALRDGRILRGAYLMVGVPHYVLFVESDLWELEIDALGREIRYHPELPHGANANFVRITGPARIEVRTWERGVEGETLACGSGVIASAVAAVLAGRAEPPLAILTRSGVTLKVELRRDGDRQVEQIRLEGDARIVYRGELTPETTTGFDPEWVRNPTSGSAPS